MTPKVGISAQPRTLETVLGPTLLHTASRFYVESVRRAGGLPLVLPVLGPEDVPMLLAAVDALVLTGGGDVAPAAYGAEPWPETDSIDEERDAFDVALVREAVRRDLPVLATCRGMQVVNVALGGTLVQHVPAVTGAEHRHYDRYDQGVHPVRIEAASELAAALGGRCALEVNSLHHQAVDVPAPGFRPVAWADDGTIEAIEQAGNGHLVAVQWHPELLPHHPEQQGLFRRLVTQAATRAAARG